MSQYFSKKDFFKLGVICSVVVSLSYFIVVILALFSPKSVITYQASSTYFNQFDGYQVMFIILKCLLLVANVAMIGVIITIHMIKHIQLNGWVIFLSILAILGLGIGMYQSVKDATQVPHLAEAYKVANLELKQVIIAFGVANPAIYALSLGLPGIWFVFINWHCRFIFSKPLVILGMAWGVGSLCVVIAHLFVLVGLIYFIEAGSLIAVPLWGVFQTHFFYKQYKLS